MRSLLEGERRLLRLAAAFFFAALLLGAGDLLAGSAAKTEAAPAVPAAPLGDEQLPAAAQPEGVDAADVAARLAELSASLQPAPRKRLAAPKALINCNGAGGPWSLPGTWSGGSVPGPLDNVVIGGGCTVTIDTGAAALDVVVNNGGILEFEMTTARTLTVTQSVVVAAGGLLRSNLAGTQTGHVLSIGTDLTNDGNLDFSTNGNTAGAGITFTGAGSATFGGSGAPNDIRTLAINKGTSRANTLEITATNFTVQGTVTPPNPTADGFLTLTNGTLKISGTFPLTARLFTAAAYSIAASAGLWLNNPNFTISGQNGSPTNSGMVRISAGSWNVGTASGNSMGGGTAALFVVEGGTLNVTGRLTNAAANVTYSQSGGTVNVSTVGNASSSTPSFGFTGAGVLSVFSGGTINLVQASTAATPLDYNQTGTMVYTGGTLNAGTAATATNFLFRVQNQMPALVLDNTTNNKNVQLFAQGNVWGSLTINPGTTLNTNNQTLLFIGPTLTNNGAITTTTNNFGSVNFAGGLQLNLAPYAQSYTGTGTFGAPALRLATVAVQSPLGVTLGATVNLLQVYRINAFYGPLINTDRVSLGAGDGTLVIVQRGATGVGIPAGTLDVAPVFGIGAGGLTVFYGQSSTLETTGPEIPATRTVSSLQIFNPTGVTIAGGPIAANAAANALLLGGGVLTTSAANLLTISNTVANSVSGGSASAYVRGPLARTLPASLAVASTYTFPVGAGSFKMLELVSPTTNAGGTVVVQVEVTDAASGGSAGAGLSSINQDRFWSAAITAGAGNFTNTTVRLTEQGTVGASAIGQSATQAGAYASIGGGVSQATIGPSSAVTTLGFFAVGTASGAPTICGSFNVGAAGAFPTLTAAMTALNSRLMTCAVVFNLTDNVYAGEIYPIVIQPNGGSSPVNTLTIKPAAGATPSFTGSSAGALLVLNGADYVTIDGSNTVGGTSRDLSFRNTNIGTTSAVIWGATLGPAAPNGSDPATRNTIKNLNAAGNLATQTGVGIGFGGSTVLSLGTRNDGNRIENNAITSAQVGVQTQGGSTTAKNVGNVITGNTLGGAGASALGRVGVFAGFEDGIAITNNTVAGINGAPPSLDAIGIALGSAGITTGGFGTVNDVANAVVTGNTIGPVVKTDTFSAAGIVLATTNHGSSLIANNMVYGVVGNGTAGDICVGIMVGNSNTLFNPTRVQYNSVSMTGARDSVSLATQPSFALAIFGNPNVDLRNNALANTQTATNGGPTGAAGSYAIGMSAYPPYSTLTSDDNDLWTSGPSAHFAATGSLANVIFDQANLAAWQSATGKDPSSISANPQFVSATDLHLDCLIVSPLEDIGTPLSITTDFDGDTRSPATPDIGADEVVRFTITASAGAGGSIAPSGTVNVRRGCNATFTITPAACFAIADVLVDGVSVGAVANHTFTNVTANHTIAASFAAAANYTITASAGAGGSIAPNGSVPVACGANQSFTITPTACNAIADVLVDGVSVGAVTNYTFTNVQANHTIAASFTATPSFTITASAGANGSISPSGAVIVSCSGSQSFLVTPAAGFAIADVLVDAVSVGAVNSYTFTNVSANHTISASFRGVAGAVPDRQSLGSPLMVGKNGGFPGTLDMTWGDSCGAAQNDFALYEGALGTWYSHAPTLGCTTGGGFSVSAFAPAPVNTYYLVVPLTPTTEGSYGTDSSGAQIPQGGGACRPSQDLACCGGTSLVGYWRFDEASGATTADSSGNGLTGTLVSVSGRQIPSTAPMASAGNAMGIGATGFIQVPDSPLYAALTGALTIEAWIYDTDGADNAILDHAGNNFLFSSHPNGQTGLGFLGAGGWTYSAGTIPTNQWVHVAVTLDGTTGNIVFYMNGAVLSSQTRPVPIVVSPGLLNIGRENPNGCQCNNFSGVLEEVRLWKVVRTQMEIQGAMGGPYTCP